MPGSDVQIVIGVDASGARAGADQAKSAVAGIGPQIEALGKTFGELGKSLKAGLDGLGQISKAIAGVGKEGGGQLQSVAISLKSVSEAVAGLGKAAPAGLQAVARSASEMSVSLSGGKLSGVSVSLKNMGEAIAGVSRSAPTGLKAVSTAAAEVSASLGSAAGQGASKLALLGEAASGLAGVGLAVGQVALDAAAATAEWAERTQESSTASAQAKQNAATLNEAIDGAGKAFSAVGDTLANAFAPVLATVVDALAGLAKGFEVSYASGGAAKTIVDTLILAFKLLAAGAEIGIGAIVAAIESVRSQIQQWRDQFAIVATAVEGAVDVLKIRFQTLGQIFKDVFSGDFGKAVSDYEAGLAQIDKRTQETVTSIQQQLARLNTDRIAGENSVGGVVASTRTDLAHLFSGSQHVQGNGASGKQHAGSGSGAHGGGGASPASGAAPTVGETCACDPAAATAREQQAQSGRTEAAADGDAQRTDGHAKANASVSASDSGLTAAAANNQAQQVADAQGADRAKVDSNNTANRQIAAANDKTLKQFQSSMNGIVNTFASGLARMAEGGESFGKVMRQVGQKILDDVFRVVVGMVEKWAWGETERVLATQQGQALLNALGLRDLAAAVRNDVAKTASALTSEHARTAATTSGVAARAAVENAGFFAQIISKLASLLGIHIATEGAKTAVTVKAASARAGASGVASFAEAPWPIDLGAPAFGSAMAGAANAFGALSSAAGGFDIPAGVNPLTQLHAQEMVLPARLANPMRDMLASFEVGGAPAASGHTFSFGDTHIHGAPNMSPSDFKQALAEHRANVAEAVAGALHGGWRPNYRQPVGAL